MHPITNQSAWVSNFSDAVAFVQRRRPVIGATSQVIRSSKWYKSVSQLEFSAIEVNRRESKLHMNTFFLEKIRRYLRGWDISLHSATTGIFQEIESFSQAELATLHAEVDICRIIGAGELIFHINSNRLHTRQSRALRPVINYAHANGIFPIYESNAGIDAKQVFKILDLFPDIGYALDLGHLNNGMGRNLLGCTVDSFIQTIEDRIAYIHANNNDGIGDQHVGLDDGTLDWRSVLDRLKIDRIRKIIIEVCSRDYLDASRQVLDHYLDKRSMTP